MCNLQITKTNDSDSWDLEQDSKEIIIDSARILEKNSRNYMFNKVNVWNKLYTCFI